MPKFAILNTNNVIINTIVAESLDTAKLATKANCIELPDSGFGDGDFWDGTQFVKKTMEEPNAQI